MSEKTEQTRFNTEKRPNWCPGCGNFGIQKALKKAMLELDLQPHQVIISSGIGCSSKLPHWVNVYGIHGLHGRTLPIATGLKLANNKLIVIAEGGDGDGLNEGMNHFIQACRRNVDLTYLIHNNGVFALTTGQASGTARQGFVSSSTPHGAVEPPFKPAALAITAGATFVARGYSGDGEQLSELIVAAIEHPGFALVDILQVCVSYNPVRDYRWYQERVYKLEGEGHVPTDRDMAVQLALLDSEDRLPTGVFYKDDRPPYEHSLPQLKEDPLVQHDITNVDISNLMEDLV